MEQAMRAAQPSQSVKPRLASSLLQVALIRIGLALVVIACGL
jgi:hypothetical protein